MFAEFKYCKFILNDMFNLGNIMSTCREKLPQISQLQGQRTLKR